MDILAGYGSDTSGASGEGKAPVADDADDAEQRLLASPARRAAESEDDSDSAGSSDESVDSATLRAAEAAARLRDFGEATSGRPAAAGKQQQQQQPRQGGLVLPSALDALGQVDRPPTFLDPEAIRPLASHSTHGQIDDGADAAAAAAAAGGRGPRQAPGKDFDISRLAPPLKGQAKAHPDKRDVPAGAVLEGRAKRYKAEDGPEATQQYTAAQIAMMGGNVAERKAPTGPSHAMPVADFLGKGVGAAQLPRRNQDRKDREKEKRSKGQSTHSHWKSEAEMVLRQQFDS